MSVLLYYFLKKHHQIMHRLGYKKPLLLLTPKNTLVKLFKNIQSNLSISILIISLFFFLFTTSVRAQSVIEPIDCNFETDPSPVNYPVTTLTLKFSSPKIPELLKEYPEGGTLEFSFPGTWCGTPDFCKEVKFDGDKVICADPYGIDLTKPELKVTPQNCYAVLQPTEPGEEHQVEIIYEIRTGSTLPPRTKKPTICKTKTFSVFKEKPSCKVYHTYSGDGTVADTTHKIVVTDLNQVLRQEYIYLEFAVDGDVIGVKQLLGEATYEQPLPPSHRTALTPDGTRWHEAVVYGRKEFPVGGGIVGRGESCGRTLFNIAPLGATPLPTISASQPPDEEIIIDPAKASDLCKPLKNHPNPNELQNCINCLSAGKAYTALGCIPTDPARFIQEVFAIVIPILSGILFLGFIYTGFLALTSTGEPEKLQHTKDVARSLIYGSLLVLFSIFIYALVGGTILGLPGFKVVETPLLSAEECQAKAGGLGGYCQEPGKACFASDQQIGICQGGGFCCRVLTW